MTLQYPSYRQVVIDTTAARPLAEFYRQLLGLHYRPGHEPPPAGQPDPFGETWLVLLDERGHRIAIQQVPALPQATWPEGPRPQQMHLDFRVDDTADLDRHGERALALGAQLLEDRADDPDEPLRIYADLAGHPFCLFVGQEE
jgi:hypothetical protein